LPRDAPRCATISQQSRPASTPSFSGTCLRIERRALSSPPMSDEFADIFEPHGRFVKLDFIFFSQSINQIGSSNRLSNAIFPAARFNQIIKEQGDDVVGLYKCAVLIDDSETVGITVGRNANSSAGFAHLDAQVFQQVIVRFRGRDRRKVRRVCRGRSPRRLQPRTVAHPNNRARSPTWALCQFS